MKTSTKILLGGLAVILFIIVIFLFMLRKSIYDDYDYIEGNKVTVEEMRELDYFHSIEARSNVNVFIKQDTIQSVKVIADENIINNINTIVSNGILRINTTERIKRAKKRDVYVTLDSINFIYSSNGANIKSEDTIVLNTINFDVAKGGKITITLISNFLNAEIYSGGTIRVEGSCEKCYFDLQAGSIVDAEDLKIDKLDVEAAAGSIVNLGDVKLIDVKASSGSIINYRNGTHFENVDLESGARLVKR
ncbi:MAG: DUF2807 domain-containing protein [Bacteroidales bacterium]|nr:DUF2807 domain-containing protein [Bacteroidales bacterium]